MSKKKNEITITLDLNDWFHRTVLSVMCQTIKALDLLERNNLISKKGKGDKKET